MAVACTLFVPSIWLVELSRGATTFYSTSTASSSRSASISRPVTYARQWKPAAAHPYGSSRCGSVSLVCHDIQHLHAVRIKACWTLDLEELGSSPDPVSSPSWSSQPANGKKTCENRDTWTVQHFLPGKIHEHARWLTFPMLEIIMPNLGLVCTIRQQVPPTVQAARENASHTHPDGKKQAANQFIYPVPPEEHQLTLSPRHAPGTPRTLGLLRGVSLRMNTALACSPLPIQCWWSDYRSYCRSHPVAPPHWACCTR